MRINHNIAAINAYRQLSQNNNTVSKHLEKLSSGLRINRAADDAAGLAISEKMRSQIRGLDVAERNALDGISLIQTAEGALTETHSILQRMRELAVQASNGTMTDGDRVAIQSEVNQLTDEINRIGNTTSFNTRTLIDGSLDKKPDGTPVEFSFQIGANEGEELKINIKDTRAQALGLSHKTQTTSTIKAKDGTTDLKVVYSQSSTITNGTDTEYVISLSTEEDAAKAISIIDNSISLISDERAKLGAVQNRLEHTVNNLGTANENLTSAESRVRDVDMALEMANYTKNNIINQSATAMLAQANQLPQGILQLLK